MPYIGKSPEFGVRERFYYTQTSAGATSISGFDDNGTSLRFTDGNYVDVYLNGVLLVDGVDYGTSTANTISSLSALADEDVVEVVVYDVFNLAKNQAEVTRTRYYKTASGGETSISGNDDDGVAITFPAGAQLDVSLNGVSLVAGADYNTSTANTIGGLSALTAGNVIEIVKYEKFVVSDTVSKAAGGTFGGAITATSFSGDGSALTGISSGVKQIVVHQETTIKTDGHVFASSGTSYRLMSAANAVDSTSKMEVTITPSSASSKILISVSCFFECSSSSHDTIWTLYRNTSTRLGQADDGNRRGGIANSMTSLDSNADSTMDAVHFIFQDEPNTTSATTYTLAFSANSSQNLFLNRTVAYGDSSGIERAVSLIMAQEI